MLILILLPHADDTDNNTILCPEEENQKFLHHNRSRIPGSFLLIPQNSFSQNLPNKNHLFESSQKINEKYDFVWKQ